MKRDVLVLAVALALVGGARAGEPTPAQLHPEIAACQLAASGHPQYRQGAPVYVDERPVQSPVRVEALDGGATVAYDLTWWGRNWVPVITGAALGTVVLGAIVQYNRKEWPFASRNRDEPDPPTVYNNSYYSYPVPEQGAGAGGGAEEEEEEEEE